MSKVSILIPSRDEKYLQQTIDDMINKARGEVEVIAVIDGPTSYPLQKQYPNLIVVQLPEPRGMRHGINLAAAIASGEYLLKMDSHCLISEGYDIELQSKMEDNWIVVARRNELSEEWVVTDTTPVDYFYMSSPWTSPQGYMRMSRWITRDKERKDIMLDETMAFSGSMWFMKKTHFFNTIKTMDEDRFGQWSGEPEELCFKTWLTGGKVMINKNVVYAHMRKDKIGRPYHIGWDQAVKGLQESARYWSSDEWPDRIYNFDWFIDHFWPLPSREHHCNGERYFWEDDWKEKYYIPQKQAAEQTASKTDRAALSGIEFDNPLSRLAYNYGSDKCPQINHHYTPVYFDLFNTKRFDIKKVLEIGIGDPVEMGWTNNKDYVTGASLHMWRDFFPNAQIYGADIKESAQVRAERIQTFLVDQSKEEDLKALIEKTGNDINLFIDDGSHIAEHQLFTCLTLMPLLKDDVIYVIEDVPDLGIRDKIQEHYDVYYKMFRHKSSWDDRLLIITKRKKSDQKEKFELETEHPVAVDSLDYQYPVGATRDNSKRPKFNSKLSQYPGSVLDLGCAGGGFIKDCIDEGRRAVGLEGTDYNKKARNFEWATIPDNLFTCDITKPFTLFLGNEKPYQFDIVTAWEVMEHIEKNDLPQLFENIKKHLKNGGLMFASIASNTFPLEDKPEIDLHRTVEDRDWWRAQFESHGFVEEKDIEGHFAGRWLRDGRKSNKFVFRKVQ